MKRGGKMPSISLSKILTKTTIEVTEKFIEKIWNKLIYKATTFQFVPPLFDEFVIKRVGKGDMRELLINSIISNNKENIPIEEIPWYVDYCIKDNQVNEDIITYYYVKWLSAIKYRVVIYTNATSTEIYNKCKCIYEIDYCYDANQNAEEESNYLILRVFDSINNCELTDKQVTEDKYTLYISHNAFQVVNIVSYYMQHYSPEVEYKEIKATQVKKGGNTESQNNGYSQKVVLKSKVKKYILNEQKYKENLKAIRTYKKTKSCWYVRGYYQHYGKDKILKYIPPRINYRNKDNTKDQLPQAKTYELE